MGTGAGANASEFERIRKAENPLNEAGNVALERAGDAAEAIGRRSDAALQTASAAMANVREKGGEVVNQTSDVVSNFQRAIEKSATNQPVTTVLMALGAGILIGAIWRSGSSSTR